MKTILILLRKEFLQIKRNKTMLPMLIIQPLIQLLILPYAATFEMKNIDLYIIDRDMSLTSRQIISKFDASPFFNIVGSSFSDHLADDYVLSGKADLILKIPQNFEKNLFRHNYANIQLLADAVNGVTAGLSTYYAQSIIADVNSEIHINTTPQIFPKIINIQPRFWYNPTLDYHSFMVSGILVLLVSIMAIFQTSFNVVREKEAGTIEQLNVTPIKKYHFITGKLLVLWIIIMIEMAGGLVIAKLIFDIPMLGSLWLLFGSLAIYLILVLSFGLLISSVSDSQQQAIFISWFFIVIFILMSGLFTSVESMPRWAQILDYLNPMAYFIKINRMILMKGSGFGDIAYILRDITIYALIMLALSIKFYKKRS